MLDHLPHAAPGCVYIIGAGPGDPGLLTCKGARFLSEADVVYYDDLLDPRLLDLAPAACQRVYAGHRGGRPPGATRRQDELNQQLVESARSNLRVVRLKGGDPYVFGRGGEEANALREAGVRFEVVPGVSAALAVPCYAGIPLTQRGVAQTVTLVTGHEDPATATVDWSSLAAVGGTLAIFMGSQRAGAIAQALMEAGRSPSTPAAAIQWGTRPQQRTITAKLSTLDTEMAAADLQSPVLLVIGEVVEQREALEWFEARPLFGRRILITRSRDQSLALRSALETQGGEVVDLPLLELKPPEDPAPLDQALGQLDQFAWIVFSSPNAVRFFFQRLQHDGRDSRSLGACRIAAIGATTAACLAEQGLFADLTPESQTAAGMSDAFATVDVEGAGVLVPSSAIGRTALDEALTARGALVTRVTAYENQSPDPQTIDIPPALSSGDVDCIVFASPSAIDHFTKLLGQDQALDHLRHVDIAVMGPTTAEAVTSLGMAPAIRPDNSSVEDLVSAICSHYSTPATQ